MAGACRPGFAPDSPLADEVPGTLDWYVDYLDDLRNGADGLRLSAHDASFDDARAEMSSPRRRYDLEPIEVGPWSAVGGAASEGPTILLLDGGEKTIMLLSYDVGRDALVEAALTLRAVDEVGWRSAGGTIG